MRTFTAHAESNVTKAKKKVNILKALAGTSWGQDQRSRSHKNLLSDTSWSKEFQSWVQQSATPNGIIYKKYKIKLLESHQAII